MSFSRAAERSRIVDARGIKTASVFWKHDLEPPDISRMITLAIPYSQAYSKNSHGSARRKHYAMERGDLVAQLTSRLSRVEWNQRKTYLEILVEKPFHNSDAINIVHGLADAVKQAIRVDDRWFCLLRVDWLVVKKNPRIYLTVGQEDGGDQVVCSVCGIIKDEREMSCNGTHSECRQCNAEIAIARHRAKRAVERVLEAPLPQQAELVPAGAGGRT